MTHITIERKNKHIQRVIIVGHSDFDEKGYDIICAAISTLCQSALLGLIQVAGIETQYDKKDGYLSFSLPPLSDESRRDADMILETMAAGLADIYEGYSDFIEMEEKSCL